MNIDKSISDIIELAQKYPVINKVGIFGSYARDEQNNDSDIDVLYDYDKPDEDYILDVLGYGEELLEEFLKLNINIDYVSYKGVVNSSNSKVRENILSDVVWLYNRA